MECPSSKVLGSSIKKDGSIPKRPVFFGGAIRAEGVEWGFFVDVKKERKEVEHKIRFILMSRSEAEDFLREHALSPLPLIIKAYQEGKLKVLVYESEGNGEGRNAQSNGKTATRLQRQEFHDFLESVMKEKEVSDGDKQR